MVEKETNTHKEYEEKIREKLAPFTDIPIIFTSVPNKQRIFRVLETANQVYKNRCRRISTSQLNEIFLPLVKENPPPAYKGKHINIKYITQLRWHILRLFFSATCLKYVREPYKRYVENKMRELFDFSGVPIQLYFRQK